MHLLTAVLTPLLIRAPGIMGVGFNLTDPEVFQAGPTQQGDEALL